MPIEVREGRAVAARQIDQGAAASSRFAAVLCVCVRGGKFAAQPPDKIWRRDLLSRSQAEIGPKHPAEIGPKHPAEIGRKHPSSVDFPILEVVRINIRLHIHTVYTDLTLGESCRDRDLWLTSGYHKPWPQAEIGTKHPFSVDFPIIEKLSEPTFVSTCSAHRSYVRRIL